MSRVLHVTVAPNEARDVCRKKNATVSVIEALPSGGSRVVLTSAAATTVMRAAFGKRVITGEVQRHPLTSRRGI